MTDYLSKSLTDVQLQGMSALALAHVGDAVYDLLVRTWLCAGGSKTSKGIHSETVKNVCAKAQAAALLRIADKLSDSETAVFKRGRNAKVNSVPKNAAVSEYHAATGLETLFGYLYLKGETERINELFGLIVEVN